MSICVRATSCLGGARGGRLTHGCPKAVAMGSDDQLKALLAESEVILSGPE